MTPEKLIKVRRSMKVTPEKIIIVIKTVLSLSVLEVIGVKI